MIGHKEISFKIIFGIYIILLFIKLKENINEMNVLV